MVNVMGEVRAVAPELSQEEANIYDRQIRLWGLESQKRLRAVRILVAGLNGLGAEVAKNLVLAGIKSITLLDSQNVTAEDFSSQFMVERGDVGKNRAHSSKAYTKNLNPMVEVDSEDGELLNKDDDFFRKFDIVCCTESHSTEDLIKINTQCRNLGVKFFCGHVWGFFGYFFSDLIQHAYTHLFKKAKILKLVHSPQVMTCVPLSRALQVKAGKASTGLDRKTSPLFFVLHVLLRFYDKHGRPLESDREEMVNLRDQVAADLAVDKERIPERLFNAICKEMCATSAVVGGVLAQDIIKVASCKDAPLKNFFLFDGFECCGLQENIGR
ncbi:LOW QUALITY PROTEIN: SUMO-activating enzyme subunit 1-like [Dermacentor silvarum]|uniref:LOW QUALITY PROTEIN: SUMO-activating enzyme subunit 1-like n=1 Tax=Dermacentor silvarum TaxID=543639 RepID=UPI00210091B0|nr:LOW QUALITY PROTEIN: SUMO-activating enzyme subunit 1-like [Dermacentor silvarum]